jgi:hypothetical protein
MSRLIRVTDKQCGFDFKCRNRCASQAEHDKWQKKRLEVAEEQKHRDKWLSRTSLAEINDMRRKGDVAIRLSNDKAAIEQTDAEEAEKKRWSDLGIDWSFRYLWNKLRMFLQNDFNKFISIILEIDPDERLVMSRSISTCLGEISNIECALSMGLEKEQDDQYKLMRSNLLIALNDLLYSYISRFHQHFSRDLDKATWCLP